MSSIYRRLVRPVLFSQESEGIHDRILRYLGRASRLAPARGLLRAFYGAPVLPTRLFGLYFPNPVGLAAGMDKQGQALPIWPSFGFGFAEIGGATWLAQPGNEKPRMFRAVADGALVNRMGFNNGGAEELARTLSKWRKAGLWPDHPVGINLGKSKSTPLAEAAEDYAKSFRVLWDCADFFVVNVSSPNTPNLRQLQDKDALDSILSALVEVNRSRSGSVADSDRRMRLPKPILVKIAPDLDWPAMDEICDLALSRGVAGIVATNTTVARPETSDASLKAVYAETGGLSGKPLRARALEVTRYLARRTEGRMPIIGVGGIFSADDAWAMVTAGASLVEVYTGFVYEGPGIVGEMVAGLARRLSERGLDRLEQAVGLNREGGRED